VAAVLRGGMPRTEDVHRHEGPEARFPVWIGATTFTALRMLTITTAWVAMLFVLVELLWG
jgi:hypothetical protein